MSLRSKLCQATLLLARQQGALASGGLREVCVSWAQLLGKGGLDPSHLALALPGPAAAGVPAQWQQWRGLARRLGGLARPRPRASPPQPAQPALSAPQVVAPDAVEVRPAEGPASEVAVQGVVGHQALIVTRPIEW